jgi:hypothetical protein
MVKLNGYEFNHLMSQIIINQINAIINQIHTLIYQFHTKIKLIMYHLKILLIVRVKLSTTMKNQIVNSKNRMKNQK